MASVCLHVPLRCLAKPTTEQIVDGHEIGLRPVVVVGGGSFAAWRSLPFSGFFAVGGWFGARTLAARGGGRFFGMVLATFVLFPPSATVGLWRTVQFGPGRSIVESGKFVLGVIVEHETGVVGGLGRGFFFLRQVHGDVVGGIPFRDVVDGG